MWIKPRLNPKNWNQSQFTIIILILSVIFFGSIIFNGFATISNTMAMFSAQLCAVAFFLVIYFMLIGALKGFGYNVLDEVFVKRNISGSIFLAGLAYALSNCISRAAM
jgi:succinate dehydrogenase hydrophobic anchor subunit